MYVVCFYWQGDRWRDKDYVEPDQHVNYQAHHLGRIGAVSNQLASRYVNNLYNGVCKYSQGVDFRFVCFTNEDLEVMKGVELRKFPVVSKQGVLPRLYMYSREAGLFGHQVLSLDLDILVVGGLRKIFNYDGLFCVRTKFKLGEEHKLDGDIISFKAGGETEELFWKPFIEDVEEAEQYTKGRERYWVRKVAGDFADTWDNVVPGAVVSYKRHISRMNTIPRGVKLISCHGFPRPHQLKERWLKRYFK